MDTKKGLRYGIDFNTVEMPGKIIVTGVALNTFVIEPDDTVRIDLVDHPLYARLYAYVTKNPPRK